MVNERNRSALAIRFVFGHDDSQTMEQLRVTMAERLGCALPSMLLGRVTLDSGHDVRLYTGYYNLFVTLTNDHNVREPVKQFLSKWMPEVPDKLLSILGRPVLAEFLDRSVFNCPLITQHWWDNVSDLSFGCFLAPGVYHPAVVVDSPLANVQTEFEHDRSQLNVYLVAKGLNAVGSSDMYRYKVVIKYASIAWLTVDVRQSCLHLFFRLRQPATVCRAKNEKKFWLSRYQLVHEWFDVDRHTIGACSVIHLTLQVDSDQRTFGLAWELLCRMQQRGRMSVHLGFVKQSNASEAVAFDPGAHQWSFECLYAWKALESRGLLVTKQVTPAFVQQLNRAYATNATALRVTLEFLSTLVDQSRDLILPYAFQRYFEIYKTESAAMLSEKMVNAGFVHVRRMIITPTRRLLTVPDLMMSNRVLREFGVDNALRVMFRSESGFRLPAFKMRMEDMDEVVRKPLTEGLTIGHKHFRFLGWSNSQLRDGGCYFYATTEDGRTVADMRKWMGNFSDIRNVAKLMARMGQCFTQSQSVIDIPFAPGSEKVPIYEDLVRKMNDKTKFCFSDGIGQISLSLAKLVASRLDIDPLPSAFQIRFAGFKGMLVLNPKMSNGKMMILRNSMHKFTTETSNTLEVVKTSQPSTVNLNRPLILILDQVSLCESPVIQKRIQSRISELLNLQLERLADMLIYEQCAASELTMHVTQKIDFRRLTESGFSLTTEVFFRNMLLSIYSSKVREQLQKLKIDLPPNLGRTVFGVLDEMGVLNTHEVFIQISSDMQSPGKHLQVITGRVLVTKCPCIVPGDVRILTAVDRTAAFSHLYDVIVFPRTGFRPLMDQMAGSDLDGDEYSVIWDEALLFNMVHPAMSFEKPPLPQLDHEVTESDMIDFFLRYLKGDSIGRIATAHLIASDRHGIFSEVPMRIARKHAMAVDFPKTGLVPDNLELDEVQNEVPDYMSYPGRVCYKSRWLPGPMTRRVRAVADVIDVSNVYCVRRPELNDLLAVDHWAAHKPAAATDYYHYKQRLFALLCEYGIDSEFQAFSNHYVNLRNRLFLGERDDYTHYTTEKVIKLRLQRLVDDFRQQFFAEFKLNVDDDWRTSVHIGNVMAKACAYYMVAYGDPEVVNSRTAYSFPWIVSDVLVQVLDRHQRPAVHSSLIDRMDELLASLPMEDRRTRAMVRNFVTDGLPAEMGDALYIFLQWCQRSTLVGQEAEPHTLFPFVHVFQRFLDHFQTRLLDDQQQSSETNNDAADDGLLDVRLSKLLMELLKFVGSQGAVPVGTRDGSIWLQMVDAAFKCYHRVAITGNLSSLYLEKADDTAWDVKESEGYVFLPPARYAAGSEAFYMRQRLIQWSGVSELVWRPFGSGHGTSGARKLVTAKGTLAARCRLYELITLDERELEAALDEDRCPLSMPPAYRSNLIS